MNNYEKYLKYKNKYSELKNFKKIKQRGGANGTNFPVTDEIHFWSRQMMEHALFLFLGLEDNDNRQLKNQAFELHQKWKFFMDQNFYDKGITVTMETVFLTADDLKKIGESMSLGAVNDLLKETIRFKSNVIQVLESGKWIGWIYPSLAKHMLQEAEYFDRKINGPAYTVIEEINFSNFHHSGELGVTAQLIDPDPSQQAIIETVRSYALKKMSILRATGSLTGLESALPFPKEWTPEEEAILQGLRPSEETNLLMLSLRFSEEVTQFADETGQKIEKNELQSVISPILAHHVHREFVRFTETLKQLSGTGPT
jgi:hypothetical protein